MFASSHTSSWTYLECLCFNYLFMFDICISGYVDWRNREWDEGRHVQEEKRACWYERDQASERLWKKDGKQS